MSRLPMTRQNVLDQEVRVISDAVSESAVLHRLIARHQLHASAHRSPLTCDMCYAWIEYHYALCGIEVPERYRPERG